VTQPRAAGDFAAIRARMEELRLQRASVLADQEDRSALVPRPHYRSVSSVTGDQANLPLPRSFRLR
jgi:hypothetical protein